METGDRYSIRLDGIHVTCSIRRSRRAKRIRMTMEDGGLLLVTVPIRTRLRDVPPILHRYKKWILKKKREAKRKNIPPPFELKNGSALRMLDLAPILSLRPSKGGFTRWRFQKGALIIHSSHFSSALIYRTIELWYRRMARLFLEDRVPYWAQRLDVNPKAIRVKNQRTLWGSCSLEHNLNFNWRILLLSQGAADYLIIHELAHIKEPNHSPEFWNLVETHSPEFKKHKAEIRAKNAWLKFPGSSSLNEDPGQNIKS